jgi:hypothetical protein
MNWLNKKTGTDYISGRGRNWGFETQSARQMGMEDEFSHMAITNSKLRHSANEPWDRFWTWRVARFHDSIVRVTRSDGQESCMLLTILWFMLLSFFITI